LALVLAAPFLLAGCGAEAYEQRLGNTKKLFEHMELVNQNLQGTWSDPGTGVGLRVPLQFEVLPAPVRTEPDPAQKNAADGGEDNGAEDAEEVPDDRQPDYMNIGLPGLRGAFRATVKMFAGNNASAQGEAFLYVMTNHDLADRPEQAREFEVEFVKTLCEALHTSADSERDWRKDRFPAGDPANNGFVQPLEYKTVTLTSSEDIAGYVRQFSAYMFDQGEIQVILLFALPADTDTSENFQKRIPLCLETLSVSGSRLTLPVKGGAPAAGTSPGSF
jgi:hypothetical protein